MNSHFQWYPCALPMCGCQWPKVSTPLSVLQNCPITASDATACPAAELDLHYGWRKNSCCETRFQDEGQNIVSPVQVLNISRLSHGGWAKIAHHLGRSGASAVSGLKLKYRKLKERSTADRADGHTGRSDPAMPGAYPVALFPCNLGRAS